MQARRMNSKLPKLSLLFILLLSVWSGVLFNVCQRPAIQKTEIVQTEDGFMLYRGGKPYYIKGAGIESHYDQLALAGGNSIRVWGINQWEEAFKMAEKYGFTVCAGLWLEQERQGFDYDDQEAVEAQFNHFKPAILKYKDHPALLMWGVGNELDLLYENENVWHAVEQIAAYIHEVDGKHPTMTATAFISQREVKLIKGNVPVLTFYPLMSTRDYPGQQNMFMLLDGINLISWVNGEPWDTGKFP
jgi:hypothetical protein